MWIVGLLPTYREQGSDAHVRVSAGKRCDEEAVPAAPHEVKLAVYRLPVVGENECSDIQVHCLRGRIVVSVMQTVLRVSTASRGAGWGADSQCEGRGATHSTAEAFDWDDRNVDKLALRGISPEDVEEVWLSAPQYRRNKRSGTASWLMIGRDVSGRRLRIGILWEDERAGILRAITGLPMER